MSQKRLLPAIGATCMLLAAGSLLPADDWPMLGRNGTRNAVSPEQGAPIDWDVESGKNIKWSARLGQTTFATPVVADGLVWIGTNDLDDNRSGVLRCFRESDGEPLYEFESPYGGNRVNDTGFGGIGCSPLVEGDRLWFTTNQNVIVCLDIAPLKRGDGEPRELWKLDPREQLGVFPRALMMGPARTCSIGASYGDRIYVVTGNGVDGLEVNIPSPEAPSLVCLDKNTGRVLWQDNSPGENILMGQFASPLVIEIEGRGQVIVPQGDGWVRSFDALTGELIWKFDMNFKESKWLIFGHGTRNDILATPVFYDGRVYLASGHHPEHGEGDGRLVCLDPTRSGDISSELAVDAAGEPLVPRRIQAVDSSLGERVIANPNSGLVWEYTKSDRDGDGEFDFEEVFHCSLSNVVIKDGLLIAVDFSGLVHCVDAATGNVFWVYDNFASVWGSPLIVDEKIYVADDDGDVAIFNLSADPAVAMRTLQSGNGEPIASVDMDAPFDSSPIFANGTLYIANGHTLFAIAGLAPLGANAPQPPGRPRVGINRAPDAVFVPTPQDVVAAMLQLAGVEKTDVVYDLGSGDGRIVIAAAKTYEAQAVGVEIDPELVKLSQRRVTENGLESLVTIKREDMFQTDFSGADVVAVFLFPQLLDQLKPQFAKLRPGARIVSHQFEIPGVEPDRTITIRSNTDGDLHRILLWKTPLKDTQSQD